MDALQTAIDNLYDAFNDIEQPTMIDGCPCCFDEGEIRKLLGTPLRQISSELLASYASSALLTVGSASDYLYYLPRILEISIHEASWWPTIEVTGRAIRDTHIDSWPTVRRNELKRFVASAVGHIVENEEYDRIDEWLCSVGRMGFEVLPCLAIIERNEKAVLAFWEDNSGRLNDGKLGNEFWDLPNDAHDEIVSWFQSEKISLIYAEAYGYRM